MFVYPCLIFLFFFYLAINFRKLLFETFFPVLRVIGAEQGELFFEAGPLSAEFGFTPG